jgi:hypothetical protein
VREHSMVSMTMNLDDYEQSLCTILSHLLQGRYGRMGQS